VDEIGRATSSRLRRARPKLDEGAYKDLAGFRFALRQFLAFSEVAAKSAGITSQQYQALLALKVAPDASLAVSEFAEQMLLVPNGAVQLVDRLEKLHLVRRKPSTIDRRVVRIELTASGKKLLATLASEHLRELVRHRSLLVESLRRLKEINSEAPRG
jgi:DNA-binding MarR family transcriptional regulator